MIALLPVHLCCAMVPPGMARVFTKHKQVIISALYPTGMGLAGGRRQTVQVQSVWGRSVHFAMQ